MLYNPEWEEKIVAPLDDWRQTLLKAADLIRARGLAKGDRQSKSGGLCIHGAIAVAVYGNAYANGELECGAVRAVCRYLKNQGAQNVHDDGAAYWNNHHDRTAEEVIAALEGAAR